MEVIASIAYREALGLSSGGKIIIGREAAALIYDVFQRCGDIDRNAAEPAKARNIQLLLIARIKEMWLARNDDTDTTHKKTTRMLSGEGSAKIQSSDAVSEKWAPRVQR